MKEDVSGFRILSSELDVLGNHRSNKYNRACSGDHLSVTHSSQKLEEAG